jgi:TnpA family transposase
MPLPIVDDTRCVVVDIGPELLEGHTSAVSVMARFGSAARGDALYEVGVGIGRLLRTIFLADYFVKPAFRRELLRVLNRGEATNALKRLIWGSLVFSATYGRISR